MSLVVYLPNEKLLGRSLRESIRQLFEETTVKIIELTDAYWSKIAEASLNAEKLEFVFIIEAHCDFKEMTKFVNDLLTVELPANVNGCFIFASNHFDTPTPELDDGDDEALEVITNMRYSQFYLRMFECYGWSIFTHTSRISSFLTRVGLQSDEYLSFTKDALDGWKDDVSRIKRAIDDRLELGVWINTSQPNREENSWEGTERNSKLFFCDLSGNLLEAMAMTHQFGRLNSPEAEKLISSSAIHWFTHDLGLRKHDPGFSPPHLRNLLQVSTTLSRDLWESSSRNDQKSSFPLHKKLIKNAGFRNVVRANLFAFDLLRDCSQMLSKGTAVWGAYASRRIDKSAQEPVKVLALKDRIRGNEEQKLTEELFKSAFNAAFRPGTLELHCIAYQDNHENQTWDEHEWWLKRIDGREKVLVREGSGQGNKLKSDLFMYDIILIEAEYSNRFVGPSIIQWLDHKFDEAQRMHDESQVAMVFRRPQIFVLSRDENAGHSYMCLWLGAQAFASKSRIFGIPSLLTMAKIRNSASDPDRKRLRPNFYALEGLLPHQRNRLQSLGKRDIVHGDEWDRNWIRKLPKADLHYHIGTSISLDTIKALAANTVGHMIEFVDDRFIKQSVPIPSLDEALGTTRGSAEGGGKNSVLAVKEVILNACKIAMLYATERAESNIAKNVDPYKHLWGAARFVLLPSDKSGRVVPKDAPEFNALDAVVQWLVRKDRPVRSHEACSILVTAITVLECLKMGDQAELEFGEKVYANWMALESAASCLKQNRPESLAGYLDSNLFYLLERIAENWKDSYTGANIKETLKFSRAHRDGSKSQKFITELAESSIKRAMKIFVVFKLAFDSLKAGELSNWLFLADEEFKKRGAEPMFQNISDLVRGSVKSSATLFETERIGKHISLDELVLLPSGKKQASGSLKRYLVGCDLLGAEHLQYPENILLAACDITRQNAEDNVVYSELRCATTGYSRGGMNVIDATDLLCKGFDLGAILFGSREPDTRISSIKSCELLGSRGSEISEHSRTWAQSRWQSAPRRWIRSNILLGAKRHKSGDIENVVPLVVHFLDRGPEVWNRKSDAQGKMEIEPASWWRMCSVAGFDLSGDEAAEIPDLESSIRILFASCSPITIHAGEAMSANSIWEAVYKLSAQRVGHGLRLRDDTRLLEHCVRNDICMELCPISNAFTNSYTPISRPELNGGLARVPSLKRDEYPMLDFLAAGLEVCLNTDNRSIHPNQSTLTDEYLKAAELCGGLTKWEVLRIAKAGFKNAFLAKDDVASMLRHVEYEIYKLICEHSGENRFPHIERFLPTT